MFADMTPGEAALWADVIVNIMLAGIVVAALIYLIRRQG